jgi:hypothetical protein
MKLSKEDLRRLKALAQTGDRDATIALLDHNISEALEHLVHTATDHRYVQGKLAALTSFRADIVIEST